MVSSLLAEQGADVVKVEAPGLGDICRVVGSRKGGMTSIFHLANRGKRGIVVDLGDDLGMSVFRRLVVTADVVVQNFRPGVAERMGIGYLELRTVRPDLVYLSITGFGSEGPLSGLRVYDNLVQAASGIAAVQGDAEGPAYIRSLACDKLTALTAAQAVTAALLARERGAGGQHVRVSMLDAAIAWLWVDAGGEHALLDDDAILVAPGRSYEVVRHVDGWTTSSPVTDAEFRGWCRALGAAHVADDARFETVDQRLVSSEFADARREVMRAAASLTVAEALARMHAEGVNGVEVVSLDSLPSEPQVVVNGTFLTRTHRAIGTVRETAPVAGFSETPASPGRAAPMPGEHTDELLAELRYTPEEIAELRAVGAVA